MAIRRQDKAAAPAWNAAAWIARSVDDGSMLGILFTGLGLLLAVPAILSGERLAIGAVTVLVLTPGVLYLVSIVFLAQRQRWAWLLLVIVAASHLAAMLAVLIVGVVLIVQTDAALLSILLLVPAIMTLMLARLLLCLWRCRSIWREGAYHHYGFEVVSAGRSNQAPSGPTATGETNAPTGRDIGST